MGQILYIDVFGLGTKQRIYTKLSLKSPNKNYSMNNISKNENNVTQIKSLGSNHPSIDRSIHYDESFVFEHRYVS